MILLRLLRLPNLIILVITLIVVAKVGIHPPLIQNGIAPSLTNKEYYLLVFIVMCIGAGGYVYNDIVDQKSDGENKKRSIVGHSITSKLALLLYGFITLAPLLPLVSLTMEIDQPHYIYYYFILTFLFWIYNQYLQRLVLAGNIMVAFLCAVAVVLPFFIEYNAMQQLCLVDIISYQATRNSIIAFASFSFVANLMREIVKDMQDIDGDTKAGYKTLPVVVGINLSKQMVIIGTLLLLTMVSLWSFYFLSFSSFVEIILSIILATPLTYILWTTRNAQSSLEFGQLSHIWKIYLLVGLMAFYNV